MNGRRKQPGRTGSRRKRGPRQARGGEPDQVSLLRLGAALAAEERELDSGWRLPGGEDLTRFAFRSGFAAATMLREASLVAVPEPSGDFQSHEERVEAIAAPLKRARLKPKRGA